MLAGEAVTRDGGMARKRPPDPRMQPPVVATFTAEGARTTQVIRNPAKWLESGCSARKHPRMARAVQQPFDLQRSPTIQRNPYQGGSLELPP